MHVVAEFVMKPPTHTNGSSGDAVLEFELENRQPHGNGEAPAPEQRINGAISEVSRDPDDGVERTSTMWTAAAYNITAIIGVGVLGIPNAMVFLSWPGVVVLVLAFFLTYFTMTQLIKLHEFELGNARKRYSKYQDLGERAFGRFWGYWVIVLLQMVVEVSLDILFTVAAGEAMNRIHDNLPHGCHHPQHMFLWFAVFAGIQLIISSYSHKFEDIKLIVGIAAIMSICYSTLAWVTLASIPVTVNVSHQLPHNSTDEKHLVLSDKDLVYRAFNAIGVIAFAYAAHNVVLEIQNGIPSTSRQSSETAMLRGVRITYAVVFLCYFPMGIAVYAVYGNQVSHNVLSFMFDDRVGVPNGLAVVANLMLIIHLVGSYQIFALPVFQQLQHSFRRSCKSAFVIRLVYIASTTVVAMIFPYFSPLIGFFGGLAIAPTTCFLPSIIWLCLKRPERLSKDWCLTWACIILGVALMIVATVGGFHTFMQEWRIHHYYKLWTPQWSSTSFYKECNKSS